MSQNNSSGLKMAQAWETAEALNLVDNLRRTFEKRLRQIEKLPENIYLRGDTNDLQELEKNRKFLSDLTSLVGKLGVTYNQPAGAYFLDRVAKIKDLFTRRLIVKKRLNKCMMRLSTALDYWLGLKMDKMENTIWGAANKGLGRNTMLDYQAIATTQNTESDEEEELEPQKEDKDKSGNW